MKNVNGFYPSVISLVGEMLENGYSYKEISEDLGLTRKQIKGIASRNNFRMTEAAKKRQSKEDAANRAKKAEINMKVRDGIKKKTVSFMINPHDTLCLYCNNTNRHKCSLFNPNIAIPPNGASFIVKNEKYYFIKSCKKFELDDYLKKEC